MTVYLGIDWSEKKHNVCILNEAGAVICELVIGHTPEGFLQLASVCQQLQIGAGQAVIGLETAHNLLIDFLLESQWGAIYVLPPSLVKSNQGRFAQSGAKDDRRDAQLIAEILRTDRGRLHAWQPDSLLTRQIRARVQMHSFLSRTIRQYTSYLRAVLLRYYPAALEVFSGLDLPITLAFLQSYATPTAAQALSYEQFSHFLQEHHHTHKQVWPQAYQRLMTRYPIAHSETLNLYTYQMLTLVDMLSHLLDERRLTQLALLHDFKQHPDAALYQSLPGAGKLLAPALLAKLGDDRTRFPAPSVLQAVAGTCPVTKRSGRAKSVHFRRACDHAFRHFVQQWAVAALKKNPVAQAYYHQVRPHCRSDNAAYRRLANRLLAVLWRLWQSRTPYDEATHLRQRALRAKPAQRS